MLGRLRTGPNSLHSGIVHYGKFLEYRSNMGNFLSVVVVGFNQQLKSTVNKYNRLTVRFYMREDREAPLLNVTKLINQDHDISITIDLICLTNHFNVLLI